MFHMICYHPEQKPSSNGQLSYCLWSFGVFDESHWNKTKLSVGWQIAMKVTIEFKLQVIAMPEIHSLYDLCRQTMWLVSGAPEHPADDTVMEKHGVEGLYSDVKSLLHAIQTKDEAAQQDVTHQMIQIATAWIIRRWLESKQGNGKPLFRILKANAHLINLEWTEEEQAKLKTKVERYTIQGASGARKVCRWQLAWISAVLGDIEIEDCNNASGQ